MKTALITGITGQDGSYLAESLIQKGYVVHGLIRRASTFNTKRIDHLYTDPHDPNTRLFLHHGDMTEGSSLARIIDEYRPNEIYNLAAQSHVRTSFDMPEHTGEVTALGTVRLLEAVRRASYPIRYYQASSSEMFGSCPPPQDEQSPFRPRSPYAAAKVYSYWMARNYREAYGIHASNGILFNHESPRRGETFVTRKVTRGIARILAGREQYLYMGNLEARRDWGYAPEYVEAMWLMLQQPEPDDYVIATGESASVRDFVREAFSLVGLDFEDFVRYDARYERPTEVDDLRGDATKAKVRLGWQATTTVQDLVRIMLKADLDAEGVPVPPFTMLEGARGG